MDVGDATAAIRSPLRPPEDRTTILRDAPAPRGNVFGAYQVFEQLGVGGMATVHRAITRDGAPRTVALKRLLPSIASDDELVRLFLHEARLVSTLRHHNIAEVYESGQVGDDYFLTMELVTGPTVKQLVQHCAQTVGLMPFPIVTNLLAQTCAALEYAHDHCDDIGNPLGLVHRDVSPSNIVVSMNGEVKLIDFGIAKTIGTHTQAGIVKGKLGYVAPEYIKGSLDRRADLWAVGVMAWELLTNCRLFEADSDLEQINKVLICPIEPPSAYNPDVPPELDAIVMTALERNPERRWQNAGALRTALMGVAQPSSNGELVEWVEWVYKLAERGLRPVRGSRPLQPIKAMNAVRLVLPTESDPEIIIESTNAPTAPLPQRLAPPAPEADAAPHGGSMLRIGLAFVAITVTVAAIVQALI